MIVNATRMLKAAKAGHYAVGHFNTNNLEWTKAILLTAQKSMNQKGTMKLINVNDTVMEIFDVTGFVDILTIE